MKKLMKMFVQFDCKTLKLINNRIRNKFFDVIMPVITILGGFVFNILLVSFFMFQKERFLRPVADTLIITITLTVICSHLFKRLISRNRPFNVFEKIETIGRQWKDKSFPSAHTATAFSNAVVLSAYFSNFSTAFYSLALLVAISRVYMGMHYPSDTLGGIVMGYIVANIII